MSTITTEQQAAIAAKVNGMTLSAGLGDEHAACSIAAINLALTGRLTGDAVPHYVNDLMRWGIEQEPFAKAEFEAISGELLTSCGFILHREIAHFGATPDALLGDDAVIEIKCPQTKTHIAWMLDGDVPEQHRAQILAQLACTGRSRAVFVSFDPRLPERQRLFMREWKPEAEQIAAVEQEARAFLADLDSMFEKLTGGE